MALNVLHSTATRAQVNGIEIVYDTFGDPGAAPMLLVAGLGNQMLCWKGAFCAQLAARGYRVIRFDNRDAGLSTQFDHADTPGLLALLWAYVRRKPVQVPYTLRDMANDAAGLLEALGIESAHVVGVSLGAMIAQVMAVHHPQRVRTLTSMMSSVKVPWLPPPKPKALVLFKPVPKDRAGYIEHGVRVRCALRGGGFPFDETHVREYVTRLYERKPDLTGAFRQLAATVASARPHRARLKSIHAPTLVIHGSADPLLPVKYGIHTAQVIPGAELLIIEGMGHELPQAAWPQVIEAICRFAHAFDSRQGRKRRHPPGNKH
jgi:pimeloyl-ACP methyl ester carboxylesterase